MTHQDLAKDALARLLYEAEEQIVQEATSRLRTSSSPHYRGMETIDLKPRIQDLFQAYRESAISGDPRFIAAFVATIGRKRLRQEYSLEELLLVVNVLSRVVWETAASAFHSRGAEAFGDLLRLADASLGAKDSLARTYEEEIKQEREAFARLNKAFSEYLKVRYSESDLRHSKEDQGNLDQA